MDHMIEFYFLISTIPGIYLATKKYFLVIPNPKYNRFIVKLPYCVPVLSSMTLAISLIPWTVYIFLFDDYTPFLVEKFTIYIALLCPLSAAILLIFILKKYFISTDLPSECQTDFMDDYELYVFMPYARIEAENIVYPNKRHKHKELDIGKQAGILVLNFKHLNKVNYTTTGEFIVNEEALEIFQKKNLTGYRIQPVSDSKKSSSDSGVQYHQIIPLRTMPIFLPKTIIQSKTYPLFSTLALNDLFYYNADVMDNVFDFQLTFEYLGSNEGVPYLPQRLWIVSKKAMRILLKEFGQQRRDFIPVMLVKDEKEIEMP